MDLNLLAIVVSAVAVVVVSTVWYMAFGKQSGTGLRSLF